MNRWKREKGMGWVTSELKAKDALYYVLCILQYMGNEWIKVPLNKSKADSHGEKSVGPPDAKGKRRRWKIWKTFLLVCISEETRKIVYWSNFLNLMI